MSMQFDPVPDVPEHPPATAPLPDPPMACPEALATWKVKVCPTSPAPVAVDCVGGTDRDVMTSPELQPEQVNAWPTTKGRAWAARPPVMVTVLPAHVAVENVA